MTAFSLVCLEDTPCLVGERPVSPNRYVQGAIYHGYRSNTHTMLHQIVIYVFARVVLGFAKLAVRPNMHPLSGFITPEARAEIEKNAWPAFASLSWAFVMYLFRWYPDTLMSSLRSSMVYMYVFTLVLRTGLLDDGWLIAHLATPTVITGTHSATS